MEQIAEVDECVVLGLGFDDVPEAAAEPIKVTWRGVEHVLESTRPGDYRLPFAESTHSVLWAPRARVGRTDWIVDASWIGLPKGIDLHGCSAQEALDALAVVLDQRAAEDAALGIICDRCSRQIVDLDDGELRWSKDGSGTVLGAEITHLGCSRADHRLHTALRRFPADSVRLFTEFSWPAALAESIANRLPPAIPEDA